MKPHVSRKYIDALDTAIKAKSGVMIAFHQNSGTFVDVIRAEGDVTLEAARAKLEAKSKDSSSTSNIRRFFPHAGLANRNLAIVGEERGKFDELTMKAIITIDHTLEKIYCN